MPQQRNVARCGMKKMRCVPFLKNVLRVACCGARNTATGCCAFRCCVLRRPLIGMDNLVDDSDLMKSFLKCGIRREENIEWFDTDGSLIVLWLRSNNHNYDYTI